MSETNEPQAADAAQPTQNENETAENPDDSFDKTVNDDDLVEDGDEVGAPPQMMPD